MNSPLLLACDPGSKRSALVIVAPHVDPHKVRFVHACMVDNDLAEVARIIDGNPVAAVAVEVASGGVRAFAMKHLLPAQSFGGKVLGLAYAKGARPLEASALVWRQAVVGKVPRPKRVPGMPKPKNPYDALVARAVKMLVAGMDESNPHTRDAAGLAVWAAWQVWQRRRTG